MTERIALITGGTGGIGTAICRRLADVGCRVAAADIDARSEDSVEWVRRQAQDDYDFLLVETDVTSFESCRAAFAKVQKLLGPVDVLVNCAGITRDGTLRKMDSDQWGAVLSVNLDSVFNMTRQAIDGMMERGFGRIVNISSVNGQ